MGEARTGAQPGSARFTQRRASGRCPRGQSAMVSRGLPPGRIPQCCISCNPNPTRPRIPQHSNKTLHKQQPFPFKRPAGGVGRLPSPQIRTPEGFLIHVAPNPSKLPPNPHKSPAEEVRPKGGPERGGLEPPVPAIFWLLFVRTKSNWTACGRRAGRSAEGRMMAPGAWGRAGPTSGRAAPRLTFSPPCSRADQTHPAPPPSPARPGPSPHQPPGDHPKTHLPRGGAY